MVGRPRRTGVLGRPSIHANIEGVGKCGCGEALGRITDQELKYVSTELTAPWTLVEHNMHQCNVYMPRKWAMILTDVTTVSALFYYSYDMIRYDHFASSIYLEQHFHTQAPNFYRRGPLECIPEEQAGKQANTSI